MSDPRKVKRWWIWCGSWGKDALKGSPIRDYPMEGTSWIDVVDGALFDALEAEHEQLKAENDHLTERLARYEHAAICTINGWGDDGTPEVQP